MTEEEPLARQKVLIVDDSMMNRIVLSDLLGDEYEILEACDGVEAMAEVKRVGDSISLMLLDINMPNMNGLEVLNLMNRYNWIESIPVIVISAENSSETVSRAFDLGATDYIDRQFDEKVVKRRVHNAIMLYARQKRLVNMIANEIYERERSNGLMVSILGHIVEFRNQESGMHVQNIRVLTEMLLGELAAKMPDSEIDQSYISLVAMASSLHDIGKISIPEEILNKPGRLTDEEYDIMKTHSLAGAEMLESIPQHQQGPLVKTAYEIARWHHERYDGRGYPDGLVGDAIPISAQVVALADVYDALTSKRVYKPAFTSEKAIEMILNGECGAFNPLLLECLDALKDGLEHELEAPGNVGISASEATRIYNEISHNDELTSVDRTIQRLEHEQEKYEFYVNMTNEIHFDYNADPPMLLLPESGAKRLGVPLSVADPRNNAELQHIVGRDALTQVLECLQTATKQDPTVQTELELPIDGEERWVRVIMRVFFDPKTGEHGDVIGKIVDIHEDRMRMEQLKHAAQYDALTGLLRVENLYDLAKAKLEKTENPYAMIIVDIDDFKDINSKYGHQYGNEFLELVASSIKGALRTDDMVARIGGDEFVVFAQCSMGDQAVIDHLIAALPAEVRGEPVSASLGVAYTENIGRGYRGLFNAADKALYAAKEIPGNSYKIYDSSMRDLLADAPSCIGNETLELDEERELS